LGSLVLFFGYLLSCETLFVRAIVEYSSLTKHSENPYWANLLLLGVYIRQITTCNRFAWARTAILELGVSESVQSFN
jgi:hypothetical protein